MKRRGLLKWATPIVVSVTIPTHATTSEYIAACYDCSGIEIPPNIVGIVPAQPNPNGESSPVPDELHPTDPYQAPDPVPCLAIDVCEGSPKT